MKWFKIILSDGSPCWDLQFSQRQSLRLSNRKSSRHRSFALCKSSRDCGLSFSCIAAADGLECMRKLQTLKKSQAWRTRKKMCRSRAFNEPWEFRSNCRRVCLFDLRSRHLIMGVEIQSKLPILRAYWPGFWYRKVYQAQSFSSRSPNRSQRTT